MSPRHVSFRKFLNATREIASLENVYLTRIGLSLDVSSLQISITAKTLTNVHVFRTQTFLHLSYKTRKIKTLDIDHKRLTSEPSTVHVRKYNGFPRKPGTGIAWKKGRTQLRQYIQEKRNNVYVVFMAYLYMHHISSCIQRT